MVLNAPDCLVVGAGKFDHVTPVFRNVLHWLPVPQRIQFKVALTILTVSTALVQPISETSAFHFQWLTSLAGLTVKNMVGVRVGVGVKREVAGAEWCYRRRCEQ